MSSRDSADASKPNVALPTTSNPTIILIHGLWMTPLCWEHWMTRYEAAGYEVIAPGWPGVDKRTPEQIRNDPSPMAGLSIANIVDHYDAIVRSLPSPPIIIGHSFGGLFVQILLSRGLGVAGVGLAPAQPAGILSLPFTTIKSTIPILSNPFNYNKTIPVTASQFHYTFGNHLTEQESNVLWERYSIPSVAHVLWQGASGGLSKTGEAHVDFQKVTRAPLLLVAGTNDLVVPKSTVEKESAAYNGPALVEFKVLEGRTHGVVNQDGWEEVADFVLNWATSSALKS